jgi:hypothetical protein
LTKRHDPRDFPKGIHQARRGAAQTLIAGINVGLLPETVEGDVMNTESITSLYYTAEIQAQIDNPEVASDERLRLARRALDYYRRRAEELEGVPEQINAYIREHEKDACKGHVLGGPTDRLKAVVMHYRNIATSALLGCERFRADLHAWLRGMVMCMEMVGNGGTHAEKAARLRGAIELAEGVIQKVINERFDFNSYYWQWRDNFRADFPVREILDQKHRLADEVNDLKRQLAEAKGVPVEEIQAEPPW